MAFISILADALSYRRSFPGWRELLGDTRRIVDVTAEEAFRLMRVDEIAHRPPGSDAFDEKTWDFAIDRTGRLKETCDRTLIDKDAEGRTLNALTAMAVIGGCTDSNENNYLMVKAFRAGIGVIPLEQQARI
jgi:hypothetical protein